ncbi:hypothetical protein [Micrococcus lylae]|uniref:hypothetical protein n=1 Tax=Micrococcus lylae TaxID=1273 RepID=UPI000833D0A4|nr:hypothetical protein [Micrococcus lylae]
MNSTHHDDIVAELAVIRTELDRLTARKRELEKHLIHDLGNGTHQVNGLKVQVTTPRMLDKKAFMIAHPPAERPDLYGYEPTLNMDVVRNLFSPAELDAYKTDGTARITLR